MVMGDGLLFCSESCSVYVPLSRYTMVFPPLTATPTAIWMLLHGAVSAHAEPLPLGETKTPLVPSATGTHELPLHTWEPGGQTNGAASPESSTDAPSSPNAVPVSPAVPSPEVPSCPPPSCAPAPRMPVLCSSLASVSPGSAP